MRKFNFILFLLIPISCIAQDKLVVFMKNGIKTETPTSSLDSITFPDETTMRIHYWNASETDISLAEIDSIKMIPDQGTARTDRDALTAFYNAALGPYWINNTNWCTDKILNQWYGVNTNSVGRVTGLDLDFNGLQGFLAPELAKLTNLKTLILQGNQLSGFIPIEFGNLTGLECLDLGNNRFTGFIPAELGKLINLNNLDLFNNQFTGPIPPEFRRLIKLRNLGLSDNQLTGSIPAELGILLNLQRLSVANNQLTGIIPKEIANLSDLNDLSLYGNVLSGNIPGELAQLSKLQSLDLSRNSFSGSIPSELFQLTNLEYLGLAGIKFAGAIPPELGKLANLQKLYLNDNQFSGAIPSELGQLTNLTDLNLHFNELTGSIPPELGKLSKLQRVALSSNLLTGSIPPEFGKLDKIEYLNLSCNHLEGAIPVELGQNQNLKNLDLSFNSYSGEIPGEIARLWSLPNLFELNIKNNRFSGVVPSSLTKHPRWNENVWGIVQQQNGCVFERETVKALDTVVTDIENATIDLYSLFESNKLTVVFKWSVADPFSGKFLPILKSVCQAYANKGLGILSYVRSSLDEVNSLKSFIRENNMTWTNVIIDNGAEFANFPGMTVPNVHIVNQNGEIVFSDQLWDKREDFEKFVTSQLGPLELYQSKDFSQDGRVTKLQGATIGKGVNVVLIGDGFVDTTLVTGGLYEQRMHEAMEHFFSIEPTKSYRDYYNVYVVKAVSKNGVFMDRSETVFSSKFGVNRGVSGDLTKIKEYAMKIEGLNSIETHIVTILNSTGRAGSCYQYEDGSISLLSAPYDVESFSGVLQHEAVGHGLGKLGDEYIDYYETFTQAEQDHLVELQSKGWCLNLSLSPEKTPWDHFLGLPRYSYVGIYEGGFYYWKGVWRPEETSTMIVSKMHYFNGPSREQIVKRTLQAAGVTYSWDDFVLNDKGEAVLKSATILPEAREFHSPPVIMNKKLFE